MNDLLNKITQIAGLNDEEKKRVINNFYKNIALQVLDSLGSVDIESANRLSKLLKEVSPSSNDELKLFIEDVLKKPEVSESVNEKIYSYTSDFASKMFDSSDEEQRKQIMEVVQQYQAQHKAS